MAGSSTTAGGATRFALASCFSNGQFKTTFGGVPTPAVSGSTYINFGIAVGSTNDQAHGVTLTNDGHCILAGTTTSAAGPTYFSVANFTVSSSLATYQVSYSGQGGFY